MEYIIHRDKCIYTMGPENEPAIKVESGSTVIFETFDCFQNQICSEDQSIESLDWNRINPATGPLYVEGANPGDVLKVQIEKIEINDYGVMAAIPGAGLLGDKVTSSEIKIVPIKNGQAIFNEKIHIPVKPMIGVIGVAPRGTDVPCGTPGKHGGNMDNARIIEKTILYLPVMVPGALLAMGDLHAVMGDGEIMVTGVEISGSVKTRVEVVKGMDLSNPLLEDENYLYTIASNEELMTAVKMATTDMHKLVMDRTGLSYNEAGMLLSAVGDLQICQVVDPSLTVRFAFPKRYLEVQTIG